MSDKFSRADKLAELPWERWAPEDLGDFSLIDADIQDDAETAEESDEIAAQNWEQELEVLRQQAYQQGLQQGVEEGRQTGYSQGYQEGLVNGEQQALQQVAAQQAPVTERLNTLVVDFQQTLDALDSVIASRLMQMALTAAQQVLGQTAVCDGSALLTQIQRLIQQEPMFSGKPQLRVSPLDMELVEKNLGVTLSLHGWRLLADDQLHSGSCKVSAEEGELDATIATRWHELCRLTAPGTL